MTSVGFQVMKGSHLCAAEGDSVLVQTLMASCNSNMRLNPTFLKDLLKFSEIFGLPPVHKGASKRV